MVGTHTPIALLFRKPFNKLPKKNIHLFLSEQTTDSLWTSFKAEDSVNAVHQISDILKLNLKYHGIEGKLNSETKSIKKLKNLVSNSKKHLKAKALASKESAQAFLKLLDAVNHAKKSDILSVLKDKTHQDITPQLMDIIGKAIFKFKVSPLEGDH